MTDREHEHWKDIQNSSHKEKLEYLLSLTKPGKNYFITPHYHTSPIREFIDITELDLERRAVEYKYIHEVLKTEMLGLKYTTDYEFIIWNGKMYRGYIETDVCIDDPRGIQEAGIRFSQIPDRKVSGGSMTNTVSYTSSITGKTRSARFNRIESISSVTTPDIGQYYSLCITGVIYNDTQEFFDYGKLALKPDCSITYNDKIYWFDNFDKLCMVVENENTLAALETL